MKTELDCPECDCSIELDYDYTKVVCPNCRAVLKLETDADLVDGSWKDLSYLVKQP